MTGAVRLAASGKGRGSHSAWFNEAGELVVEWYDFGEDVPYESANILYFGPDAQVQLLGEKLDPPLALQRLGERFESWWQVKDAARRQGIAFRSEVDFQP